MSALGAAPNVSALIPTLARQIIEMIRREGYPIGHRLTEQALCDELAVSRSPVRKALQYLQAAGVVSSEPNRGYQVAKLGAELGMLELAPNPSSEETIYMRIANDRINGLLPDEIAEADLMSRYDLGRLQVQRVLNRMSRESMIARKSGRSWIFRPLLSNVGSHRESYRFRMIIEPAAILEPGYQVNIAELEKCRREQTELLQGGIERCTPAELFRSGVHLHETIVAGANNRFLLDSLRTLNQMRHVVEYGTRLDRARLHRQCEEHLVLIDLLVKGERMEASQFLRQHLNTARITKIGDAD
ncbi:GntR family transcriptional regulator [Variovorax guangxiensis]|uniref:DNA-binding GntR family transcriptional regulator n=1 Tax=Variovorax guangxiensis TaxID=1775474 RepID=A0A840FXG0_9BURK|nr:GntR family transcriptional regulator [Variovorax guangxiensis]MBB4224875.1 DNA-binding GntR family transcriptional regulator [Variovorax guangxiensis]